MWPTFPDCKCFFEIIFQVSKRDITLLDRSEKSVRVTLWGGDVCGITDYNR